MFSKHKTDIWEKTDRTTFSVATRRHRRSKQGEATTMKMACQVLQTRSKKREETQDSTTMEATATKTGSMVASAMTAKRNSRELTPRTWSEGATRSRTARSTGPVPREGTSPRRAPRTRAHNGGRVAGALMARASNSGKSQRSRTTEARCPRRARKAWTTQTGRPMPEAGTC